jgi:hypothetical protein
MSFHDKLRDTRSAGRAERWAERRQDSGTYIYLRRRSTSAAPKNTTKQKRSPSAPPPGGSIVAIYDYTDHTGAVLYQVVRFEPKTFRQRQPRPGGGWRWNLHGVSRVLYDLPTVLETVTHGRVVMVCEGERDADTIARLGLCSTTCNEGAGAWLPSYSETLRGAGLVVILADNDRAGEEHGEQIARSLHGHNVPVKVVCPWEPGQDVTEWMERGGTFGALIGAIREAPWWKPSSPTLLELAKEPMRMS